MTPDWTALDQELARWQEAGMTLPIWWRDDDAIAPTPQLERLLALSEQLSLPVHLAIIPRDATPELAKRLSGTATAIPVVHGWAHENHAAPDQKKSEFGADRVVDDALDDAERGLKTLERLFGSGLQPMFVPPWNRLSEDLEPWLAGLGYSALSTFTPRSQVKAAPGLLRVNTHLDPIDWKGTRSLVVPALLLSQLVKQLADRRLGKADNDEPYGILTHHLVHDDAIWAFCEDLLRRLLAGPARPWVFEERKS